MKKSLLFICFDYPPNNDIGGRRTAKFSKELAKRGYRIKVIKANPVSNDRPSIWSKDVIHHNIEVHSLPRTFPKIISHPEEGIINRIKTKFFLWRLSMKSDGTIYDFSIGWDRFMIPKAKELIYKHNIENVFVSGAPFNLFYYSSQLKEELPTLNIIADYRDPWITALNYGMANLSTERMLCEKKKQHYVFTKINHIICPNPFLLNEIKESDDLPGAITADFSTITHFFDDDEYKNIERKRLNNQKIKIVYGGTLYKELEPYLEGLADWLTYLKNKNRSFYGRIDIEFFTKNTNYKKKFKGHEDLIKFNPQIGREELIKKQKEADGLFIFLANHTKDYLTTKFFESLPFQIPLIFFGPKGHVSNFIMNNGLGYVITDFYEDLDSTMSEILRGNPSFNKNFEWKKYSLQNATTELEYLLV